MNKHANRYEVKSDGMKFTLKCIEYKNYVDSDFDWKYLQNAVNTEVKMIKYGYSNGKCKLSEIVI